jgi:hypothetical protein
MARPSRIGELTIHYAPFDRRLSQKASQTALPFSHPAPFFKSTGMLHHAQQTTNQMNCTHKKEDEPQMTRVGADGNANIRANRRESSLRLI